MRVPLLDLAPQLAAIGDELRAAVLEVVASTRYVGGPRVARFEAEIAAYLGTGYAIGVSSGTDALIVSLMALGVGPGDLIVTTPYSFFATAGSVARLGADPVFVDVEPGGFDLDPEALAAWLEDNPRDRARVKAILPVHLFGQCADMAPILAQTERYGIPVVEDAAQAIGARCHSRGDARAGSMGTLGCFSFFPSKNLGALGDGGLVVTGDAALHAKIVSLRDHGARARHVHDRIGGNFRLDAIQAAVLSVKLPHLDVWSAARRENAAYYDAQLAGTDVTTPALRWGRDHHVYNQYVVQVPEGRDALRGFLADREIDSEVYYPVPLHLQACFAKLGHASGSFPHSEEVAGRALALPIYPDLTREMQDHVVATIREFFA